MNPRYSKFSRVALIATAVLSPLAAKADVSSDLSTAATTGITAVLTVMGAILVAGFAIPLGKKTYKIIRGALGAA